MSDMYEQANKLNIELKKLKERLQNTDMRYVEEYQATIKDILNIMIRFGQTAKFRCRSNVAYDNFVSNCFNEIATVKRTKPENLDFEVLEIQEIL